MYHFAVHIGESSLDSIVVHIQFLMMQAKQVKNGGV